MKGDITRPDTRRILAGLKDFQRDTVEYVFERLYGPNPTSRFLIADEVGLGKTLVAKGVIAKAIDLLWEKKDRIDVVYICSNADIARQNINRLNVIPSQEEFTHPSRVTLLPTLIKDLQRNPLNFISLRARATIKSSTSAFLGQLTSLCLGDAKCSCHRTDSGQVSRFGCRAR